MLILNEPLLLAEVLNGVAPAALRLGSLPARRFLGLGLLLLSGKTIPSPLTILELLLVGETVIHNEREMRCTLEMALRMPY